MGMLAIPLSNDYYVQAAQTYKFDDVPYLALRCPTFPSLYIVQHYNTADEECIRTFKIVNPYKDYEFEYESACDVEEIGEVNF